MKAAIFLISAWTLLGGCLSAEVKIDEELFGKSLGGWSKRSKQAAEYPLSGAVYRTYKPEITPTPDGGLFVSIRIDHVRGWLSSDDHAMLEITVGPKGGIASAQSNIAIQGRSITSDVILGVSRTGPQLGTTDRAVQIGTELIADLSAKLLREKIVEAGRVSFPAAVRHNYNLLFQAIRNVEKPVEPPPPVAVPVSESGIPETISPSPPPSPTPEKPAQPTQPEKSAPLPPPAIAKPIPSEVKLPATEKTPESKPAEPKPTEKQPSSPAEPTPPPTEETNASLQIKAY